MKTIMIALVGLVGLSAMGGDAQMRAFPDGARVAFFGDSLTAGGGVVLRIAAHYRTAFPGRDVRFYNCGISGGRLETADMYFDVVLASRRPTHVVFAFGLNDALEAYNRRVDEPAAEERRVVRELAEFRSRYAEAIGRIEALGAKIVLRIPTPYNEFGAGDSPADAGKNEVVRRFGDEVRAFACRKGLPFVDDYARMSKFLADGADVYIGDRIHPNDFGQWRMAETLLSAQGLEIAPYRTRAEVASAAGLSKWDGLMQRLSDINAFEWQGIRDESIGRDEKIAKAKKWLETKGSRPGVHPFTLRVARAYVEDKPREEAIRAAAEAAWDASGNARETPDWFRRGVMYQIQPRAFTPEGTIKAAEGKLAELADLGVTVVYMCPVTAADDDPREDMWSPRQVRSGFNNPRNPYRTGDYFHVDPEYGTDADFRSFVKTAHDNGIKVLMDIVYLHCGPSARVVKDHPEYFSYDKNGKMVMAGWRFPKLNFDSRGVREYFKANMVYWLSDFDVDGFRCDVADCIPLDFWEDARDACESVKGGIVILAEGCRHANTRHAFDANYNWPVCLSWLRPILKGDSKEGYNRQWAAGGADVSAFNGVAKLRAASEQYAAKCPKGTLNMNFTENHDTSNDDYENRMEKTCGWDNQTLGLALCFAMEGIPLIYNGQEIADAHRHSIFGHSPDVTVDWANAATPAGHRRREMVRAFAALRRDNPAMTAPGQKWLDNDKPESVLSLRRGGSAANGIVFVGNFSKDPTTVRVDSVAAGNVEILLSNGAAIDGEAFGLAPWGFAFARNKAK